MVMHLTARGRSLPATIGGVMLAAAFGPSPKAASLLGGIILSEERTP
jgi:hypothetical protein